MNEKKELFFLQESKTISITIINIKRYFNELSFIGCNKYLYVTIYAVIFIDL